MRRFSAPVLVTFVLALTLVSPAGARQPAFASMAPAQQYCDPAVPQTFASLFGGAGKLALTGVAASPSAAFTFVVGSGVPDSLATDFIASFDGPMTARLVEPEESFYRYTAQPDSRGSFLTKTSFDNSNQAVVALALFVTGNTASYRQTVIALQCTIVLEGGIKDGAPDVLQTLAPNRDAFDFGLGVTFGSGVTNDADSGR